MAHIKYETIADAAASNNIIPFYNAMYKVFINHSNPNQMLWVDRLLDNYNHYKSMGFTVLESKINGLADSLEEMVINYNLRCD